MANPDWRSVKKTHWIDKNSPFKVGKVDESLIMWIPNKANKSVKVKEPYTGISEPKPPRDVVDSLKEVKK